MGISVSFILISISLTTLMNQITLITNKMCPYARKAAIALSEKSSEFNLVDVDLINKSQFFKESYSKAVGRNPSRDGAVPIIIDQDVYLCESQPVVWYVAEKYKNVGNDLIPEDHVERFRMRLFIEEFSKKIGPVLSKLFGWQKKSEEEKNKQKQQVNEFFENLNKKLVLPYALGEQFTVADILIYTHLQLWGALEHFTGVGIDKKYEKIYQFISQVQKRQSVKKFIQPKQAYVEALQKFF